MAQTLSDEQVREGLEALDGWEGDASGISRTLTFADFTEAMGFVTKVALAAERAFHHPDVSISWATVELRIVNHSLGGVSDACLELAERIDRLAG